MKLLLKLIGFNADFTPRFICYYGGKSLGGGDKTTANTTSTSTTDVTTTNQQTGASEGSFAVGGSGNTVTTEDPKTLQHIADVNADVSKTAIGQVGTTAKDALNFGSGALDTVGRTVQQANDILARSFESYAGKIESNAGSAPSTVAISGDKNQMYIVIASVIAVVIGAVVIFKPTTK